MEQAEQGNAYCCDGSLMIEELRPLRATPSTNSRALTILSIFDYYCRQLSDMTLLPGLITEFLNCPDAYKISGASSACAGAAAS